jgi:hypothetical protein
LVVERHRRVSIATMLINRSTTQRRGSANEHRTKFQCRGSRTRIAVNASREQVNLASVCWTGVHAERVHPAGRLDIPLPHAGPHGGVGSGVGCTGIRTRKFTLRRRRRRAGQDGEADGSGLAEITPGEARLPVVRVSRRLFTTGVPGGRCGSRRPSGLRAGLRRACHVCSDAGRNESRFSSAAIETSTTTHPGLDEALMRRQQERKVNRKTLTITLGHFSPACLPRSSRSLADHPHCPAWETLNGMVALND